MKQPIVVVTTTGSEGQANLIARTLVSRREAACVNIVRGVRSIYRWKGNICNDEEFLLIAKTVASEFEAVEQTIRELHNYDVPEILAFDVSHGEQDFLDWMTACVDKDVPYPDDDDDEDEDFPFTDTD